MPPRGAYGNECGSQHCEAVVQFNCGRAQRDHGKIVTAPPHGHTQVTSFVALPADAALLTKGFPWRAQRSRHRLDVMYSFIQTLSTLWCAERPCTEDGLSSNSGHAQCGKAIIIGRALKREFSTFSG
mmetsp:Transcript_46570/g.76968  ORF Transcript_46570/g.76968 Transcript_46570/m.76968 type:complete len:127 (-) Transcript_46570:122-502(-)